MKKDIEIIKDADRIKVSLEETRDKILALLRVNDMSISQISEALNKDQSTINRHIKKLESAGFIKVVGERKEHHIPERIYGRTADAFLLNPDAQDPKKLASLILKWNLGYDLDTLEKLDILGYENNVSDETLANLLDFLNAMNVHLSNVVDEVNEELVHMNYTDLLRMKLLIYLIEIKKNPEIKDNFDNIFSQFNKNIKLIK